MAYGSRPRSNKDRMFGADTGQFRIDLLCPYSIYDINAVEAEAAIKKDRKLDKLLMVMYCV